MTTHPGDKPIQRFVAYVGSAAAMVLFAIIAWVLLALFGAPAHSTAVVKLEEGRRALAEKTRAEQVKAVTLAEVDPASGLARVPVDSMLPDALARLQTKKAKKSPVPVPGTEAALKLLEQQQAPAKPAAAEPEKPKPAQPAPADASAKGQARPKPAKAGGKGGAKGGKGGKGAKAPASKDAPAGKGGKGGQKDAPKPQKPQPEANADPQA